MTEGDGAPAPAKRTRRTQRLRLVAGIVAAFVLVALAVWVLRPPANTEVAARPTPTATPTPTPSPSPTSTSPCANPATEPFKPTRITVPGIIRNGKVLALARDNRNVPLVPPTAATGKLQTAWDRPPGIKPGSPKGNVLLNAHTWPDGSALGNKLLKRLDEGDRIILRGDDATLCYEVDERIEVRASEGYPPYYDREGPPKIAFLVCSGKRLGPGEWTHRTIWLASPVEA
jgi:hypothetical protein